MMKVYTRIKNNQQYKNTAQRQNDKPGYVESDHLSRIYVTIKLKQPT